MARVVVKWTRNGFQIGERRRDCAAAGGEMIMVADGERFDDGGILVEIPGGFEDRPFRRIVRQQINEDGMLRLATEIEAAIPAEGKRRP